MTSVARKSVWQKHIALTQEHGSWVFLFSPLLIGLFAGGRFTVASAYLMIGALAAFLIRQPLIVIVKVISKRRSRLDLPAAYFWTTVYGLLGFGGLWGLWQQGEADLAVLALPGLPVFAWYLYLVSRRAERRQLGVEIVAGGVLALAAPAAYWIGVGHTDPQGWWLWGLAWLQTAASIVYAGLRLEQRVWKQILPLSGRVQAGARALLYSGFNLAFAGLLAARGVVAAWLWLPFMLQFAETIWGTLRPAVGVKPTRIGLRLLTVSTLFTLLFIVIWG